MSDFPHNATITVSPNDDVYVECFLIDGTHLNDKGWKVSFDDPQSFDNTVQRSLGHPLVLYEKILPDGKKIWDHPVSETGSVEDDIEFQKPYIIGKAVHNKKVRDGLWHTTYKIINEAAKRFLKTIKERSVSLFTSPHIVRPVLEDRKNIKTWAVVHNAIVSSPANGKQLAKVASICEGDPKSSCASLFASMDTPDRLLPKCGYCLGNSLKEYVTSHSLKTENSSSMSENSQGQQSTSSVGVSNGQTSPIGNNPNAVNNDNRNGTQTILNQTQQQQQGQQHQAGGTAENNGDAQQTIAELKARIKELESQSSNNEIVKNNETRIANLEKELALTKRTAAVEKLLTQAIALYTDDNGAINEKEYNADLKKLVDSNHNLEEIQELIQAKYVIHQDAKRKLTGNKASNTSPDYDSVVTSQVSESASIHYTEMNGSSSSETKTESASTINNASKGSQEFVNVLNHLNTERLALRSKFGGLA